MDAEPLWREAVGRELRRRRTGAGRTLADVAEQAGISVPYLSEIERGRKEPSSEMLAAVLGALGCGLVDLTSAVGAELEQRPVAPVISLPVPRNRRTEAHGSGPVLLAA